jgi:hypothetical protein
MPDLQHLWQRFLLAAALIAGLAIGVGATIFGYSNLNTVDLHWSVLRLSGVPVWAVVLVPITLILIAGTIFHWLDGLHHFTEHMRHRRRVHELEAEVTRLKAHLDQVLEMPRGEALKPEDKTSLPAPELVTTDAEMSRLEGEPETKPDEKPAKTSKRAKLLAEPLEAAKPAENGAAAEPVTAAATPDAPNDAG